MKETHIMIDLETLAKRSTSAIIAVGACVFDVDDPGSTPTKTFYRRVDWASAMRGRAVDGETLKWWMKQSDEARYEAIKNGRDMAEVLYDLAVFLKNQNSLGPTPVCVWGNGANFDIGILETAYLQYNQVIPWEFWNVRDCRTAEHLAQPFITRGQVPRDGTHHNALDDALYQAKYVSRMWHTLRNRTVKST